MVRYNRKSGEDAHSSRGGSRGSSREDTKPFNKGDYRGKSRGSGRGSSRSFGRSGSDRGRRRDSRSDSRGDSKRIRPEMHKVTCDGCGVSCEVPFEPTAGKPVYCNDCFKKEGPSSSKSAAASDLKEINRKLDLIIEALHINQ